MSEIKSGQTRGAGVPVRAATARRPERAKASLRRQLGHIAHTQRRYGHPRPGGVKVGRLHFLWTDRSPDRGRLGGSEGVLEGCG